MSKRMYRFNKSPLKNKRNRAILLLIAIISVILIIYSLYFLTKDKPADGKKQEIVLETGDRPIKKDLEIYIKADGGLSLRSDRNTDSQRLELIPNNTKLVASEELDGWYHVTYNSKTGWISKQYTTLSVPAEDPTKNWASFTSSAGYTVKYQVGWKAQDYGANTVQKASSLVAFSNQDLPTAIPAGSDFIAPVVFALSTKTIEEANASFSSIAGMKVETMTVAGQTANKYTYTSATSNTQMTAIVLKVGGKVFILSEGGGYAEDLLKMTATFTIG